MGENGSDTNVDWAQISPTSFARPIDNLESFFQSVAGSGQGCPEKQNWHTTGAIKITTHRENFVDDVKTAWKALRFQYPCYSAILENDYWIYNIAETEELSSWLQETFHVHYDQKTARQLFPFDDNPSKRVFLHVLPNTQELVLHGPHTHVDAIGMMTFFDALLKYLVNPTPIDDIKFGDEDKNLSPPFSILAGLPISNDSEIEAWNAHVQKFASQIPSVNVNNQNKGAPATRPAVKWLIFSKDDTKKIVTRSRELGFTLTAAVQAAASRAACSHGNLSKETHATFAIYDGRSYIDNNIHPHTYLVGPHVLSLPVVFPIIPDSFTKTAKAALEVFLRCKEDDTLRQWHPIFAIEFPKTMAIPMPPDFPVAADLITSSSGILDKYISSSYTGTQPRIEVQDVWLSLDLFGPGIGLALWTFGGKLTMELMYNEAYHDDDSVHLLLKMLFDELAQGLGINLGFDARSPGDEDYASKKSGRSLVSINSKL